MLFREVVAVYSKNYTKPIIMLCEHNAEFLILKHVLRKVPAVF